MTPVDLIFERFERHGGDNYGAEKVRQLEHALQCAELAEAEGPSESLIAAALLHDIGHLVHDLGETPPAHGIDDRHELIGRQWLARWFDEAVTEPVRLHVNAKRYLTATEPGYFGSLSFASVRSLELQGGPFTCEMAAGFICLPYAREAVRLRRWDEAAKVPGKATPDLGHFRRYLEASLADRSGWGSPRECQK
ncbi:MAG TPA: HD domain-containing protein [Stellaceae bacterium]|jgi:phosphonate degradation associated HDIG domain protein|nr:HD domain-containing protein [Stellaceae bacterium]